MANKIKKQLCGIALLVVSAVLLSVSFDSCKKKDKYEAPEPVAANEAPHANAGKDVTITFPKNSVDLSGDGSWVADGSSAKYNWTQTSGAACTLSGSTTFSLTASNLVTGVYAFKLTVADAAGKTDSDDVTVTVGDLHKKAIATIGQVTKDTVVSGTATFTQKNSEDVTLTLDIKCPSKANSSVAVHIHMMPDCGAMANNAKGHWNPTNALHGQWGGAPGTYHIGDIGNIPLDANGNAIKIVTTNLWNINGVDTSRNVVNRSIMVHYGVDDYTTQPTGNSGVKVGCGVIK